MTDQQGNQASGTENAPQAPSSPPSPPRGKNLWWVVIVGGGLVVLLLTVAALLAILVLRPSDTSTVTPTTEADATEVGAQLIAPLLTPSACTPDATLVTELIRPDSAEFPPGRRLDKVWQLRNTGDCPWVTGYRLVFVSGDAMGADATHPVPKTRPDETADVHVTLYAPESPGSYTGRWQLKDDADETFGPELTVEVEVGAPRTPPRTPESAPTLEATLKPTAKPPLTPKPKPPKPTATPKPPPQAAATPPCVPSIHFQADDTHINAGDHTTLRWDVECVQEVHLDGAPVTGHGTKVVSPTSTKTYTLHVVRNDGSTVDRQVTVQVQPAGGSINATITYHSYDSSIGVVKFKIVNAQNSTNLKCVAATIINSSTHTNYFGPDYSNTPFRPDPTSSTQQSNLPSGDTKYIHYKLTGSPTGVPCRATFRLYTGNDKTGQHVEETVNFSLPGGSPPSTIQANITYHSYDSSTGWVTFKIVNSPAGAQVECVEARINHRFTNAVYYGPNYSDTPFRPDPTSNTLEPNLPPGATKYLRYKLTGSPTGVPCRGGFIMYTGDGKTGSHVTQLVFFSLP